MSSERDLADKERSGSGDLHFEWLGFLAALGLMSRVPISLLSPSAKLDSGHRQRSPIWYPLIGLFLGMILCLVLWLLSPFLSPTICAALILLVWVGFSGALHLDGLADTADAWVGGMGSSERTLSIMKDPACGPIAVVVLVFCLLFKYLLILSVINSAAWILLVIAPTLARSWILPILIFTPYAGTGIASDIAKSTANSTRLASFIASLAITFLLLLTFPNGFWIWLVTNLLIALQYVIIRHSAMRRISGYTGDILGAAIELNEVLLLLGAVLFLSS